MINIANLLTNDSNIIEIYLLNPNENNKEIFKRNIYIDSEYINKIKSKFKLTKEATYIYFNRNNLSYVYDNTNDSQYVFLRKLENIQEKDKLFGIAFNEMKMQTHSFACTNDIDNKTIYKIYEFKINNRITILIKNNNLLIQYKHSKEVDIDKIQEIINGIIRKLQ
jgi:hypothetical protein